MRWEREKRSFKLITVCDENPEVWLDVILFLNRTSNLHHHVERDSSPVNTWWIDSLSHKFELELFVTPPSSSTHLDMLQENSLPLPRMDHHESGFINSSPSMAEFMTGLPSHLTQSSFLPSSSSSSSITPLVLNNASSNQQLDNNSLPPSSLPSIPHSLNDINAANGTVIRNNSNNVNPPPLLIQQPGADILGSDGPLTPCSEPHTPGQSAGSDHYPWMKEKKTSRKQSKKSM